MIIQSMLTELFANQQTTVLRRMGQNAFDATNLSSLISIQIHVLILAILIINSKTLSIKFVEENAKIGSTMIQRIQIIVSYAGTLFQTVMNVLRSARLLEPNWNALYVVEL